MLTGLVVWETRCCGHGGDFLRISVMSFGRGTGPDALDNAADILVL